MQPLKISIPGDFWDIQIYRGRLYLWDMHGSVTVYNWDGIIDSIIRSENDRLQYRCAFTHGSYLYGSDFHEIFSDSEVKNLLLAKFARIPAAQDLDVQAIGRYCISTQLNPFDELPTDTEIFLNCVFAATDSGLYYTRGHDTNRKTGLSRRVFKLTDCPVLSFKANKYSQFALSAGDEGLFEYDYNQKYRDESLTSDSRLLNLSKGHSQFADWAFSSIYSSSVISNSYLSLFEWEKAYRSPEDNDFYWSRKFKENVPADEIFGRNQSGLSWGAGDKLYRVVDNGIEIVPFTNYADKVEDSHFQNKKYMPFRPWKGRIIAAGSSFFGSIVECENALVIILSDDSSHTIEGPITRWRVYPRSINYENHLHVVKKDCVEIYSFNHDYFVDQANKLIGTRHTDRT